MIIVLNTQGLCPFQTGACREKCCRPVTVINTSLMILYRYPSSHNTIHISIAYNNYRYLYSFIAFRVFVIFLYLHFVKGVLHLSTLCAPLFYMLILVHTTYTSETYAVNSNTKVVFSFTLIMFLLLWMTQKKNSLRDSLHSVLQHLRLKLVVVFSTVCQVDFTTWPDLENCACT